MSRAGGSSWFHLHDYKSITARCHFYIFGFNVWLVFDYPTVLVGNTGLIQWQCKQRSCTAAVHTYNCTSCSWEHWAALACPNGTVNMHPVNIVSVSVTIKHRQSSCIQGVFRVLQRSLPLAFKRNEYSRNSWDETVVRMMLDYDEGPILQSDGLRCNFIRSFC